MTVKDCIDEIKHVSFLIDALDSYLAGYSGLNDKDAEDIRITLVAYIDEIHKRMVDD